MLGLRRMPRCYLEPILGYVGVSLEQNSAEQRGNSRHTLIEYTKVLIIKASSMWKAEDIDSVARA